MYTKKISTKKSNTHFVFLLGELLRGRLRLLGQDVIERLRAERLQIDLLVVVPELVTFHLDAGRWKPIGSS